MYKLLLRVCAQIIYHLQMITFSSTICKCCSIFIRCMYGYGINNDSLFNSNKSVCTDFKPKA